MNPTPEMNALLRRVGSADPRESALAARQFAKALELPLNQGILRGDNLAGIFEDIRLQPGQLPEFPIDFLTPSNVNEFVAYTIPNTGRLPEKHIDGDYVMVTTYYLGASIDTDLKYLRDARWDVVARMLQVMEAMYVRKKNTDGWRVLLAAATGRNIVIYDDAATAGLFTKRLVALMKTSMRRNGGGNASSIESFNLSDLFVSPESLEDMRSWDLSQVDDITRREIMVSDGGPKGEQAMMSIFGVRLHLLDELGVGQEYQNYYANTLGGSMPGSKTEIVVGFDLSPRKAFVRPIRQDFSVFEDVSMFRQNRFGLWGRAEFGLAALSSTPTLLGAI